MSQGVVVSQGVVNDSTSVDDLMYQEEGKNHGVRHIEKVKVELE